MGAKESDECKYTYARVQSSSTTGATVQLRYLGGNRSNHVQAWGISSQATKGSNRGKDERRTYIHTTAALHMRHLGFSAGLLGAIQADTILCLLFK